MAEEAIDRDRRVLHSRHSADPVQHVLIDLDDCGPFETPLKRIDAKDQQVIAIEAEFHRGQPLKAVNEKASDNQQQE